MPRDCCGMVRLAPCMCPSHLTLNLAFCRQASCFSLVLSSIQVSDLVVREPGKPFLLSDFFSSDSF